MDMMDGLEFHESMIGMICKRFAITEEVSEQEKLGGAFNTNIRIAAGRSEYVLRISSAAASEEQLREIYRLQQRLSAQGIPVPLPHLTENGEPYIRMDGKLIQVLPYIAGEPFRGGECQVRSSGAMLRSFHEALTGEGCPLKPPVDFHRTYDYCREALQRLKGVERISRFGLTEAAHAAERIYARWSAAEAKLPQTILHGDWHFWNQLYTADQVTAVLDLDYMHSGPRIMDVAYAMWIIHILLPNRAASYRRAFLAGYGALYEEEIEILPYAAARIALFFLCHAAYSSNPARKWHKQYANQMPFINWLLTAGGNELREAAQPISSQQAGQTNNVPASQRLPGRHTACIRFTSSIRWASVLDPLTRSLKYE